MRKFLVHAIGFFLLVGALYAIVSLGLDSKNKVDQSNSYMAVMIDKHKRVQEIKGPKIMFVGGSNLAFGLNSEEVENAFSIPVVNMGLHAGLGIDFILNEAAACMKSGDVVFLSVEYQLDNEGNYELKKNTSSVFTESKKYYEYDIKKEIISNLDRTRNHVKSLFTITRKAPKKFVKKESIAYTRAAFNKFGDHIGHIGNPTRTALADRGIMNYYKWPAIKQINEFQEKAKSKNVHVFFLFPNYPESEYKKNREVIGKFASDLTTQLHIDVVNTPNDLIYPDSLFYDTVYHLSGQGRQLRTKKLIELIRSNKKIQYLFTKMRS
jgi:hypothetical protein